MSTITIEGMEFHAFHGCLPEEAITGNTFIIDVYLETDTSKAEKSDDLNDTVNYSTVYEIVNNEMAINSKLLEHVGRRILNSLQSKLPEIEYAEVKVSKKNPPIGGQVEHVSLIMNTESLA